MPNMANSRNLSAILVALTVAFLQLTTAPVGAEERTIDTATLTKAIEPLRASVAEFRRLNNTWPTQEWSQAELRISLEKSKLAPDTLLVEDFWTDDNTFFLNLLDPVSGDNLVMTGNPDGVTVESR